MENRQSMDRAAFEVKVEEISQTVIGVKSNIEVSEKIGTYLSIFLLNDYVQDASEQQHIMLLSLYNVAMIVRSLNITKFNKMDLEGLSKGLLNHILENPVVHLSKVS